MKRLLSFALLFTLCIGAAELSSQTLEVTFEADTTFAYHDVIATPNTHPTEGPTRYMFFKGQLAANCCRIDSGNISYALSTPGTQDNHTLWAPKEARLYRGDVIPQELASDSISSGTFSGTFDYQVIMREGDTETYWVGISFWENYPLSYYNDLILTVTVSTPDARWCYAANPGNGPTPPTALNLEANGPTVLATNTYVTNQPKIYGMSWQNKYKNTVDFVAQLDVGLALGGAHMDVYTVTGVDSFVLWKTKPLYSYPWSETGTWSRSLYMEYGQSYAWRVRIEDTVGITIDSSFIQELEVAELHVRPPHQLGVSIRRWDNTGPAPVPESPDPGDPVVVEQPAETTTEDVVFQITGRIFMEKDMRLSRGDYYIELQGGIVGHPATITERILSGEEEDCYGSLEFSIPLENLARGHKYWWRARAYIFSESPRGNRADIQTDWSPTDTFSLECPKPARIEANYLTSTTVDLSWSTNTLVDRHVLWGRQQGVGPWRVVRKSGQYNTGLYVNILTPSTTYEVTVKHGCDAFGAPSSEFSDTLVFETWPAKRPAHLPVDTFLNEAAVTMIFDQTSQRLLLEAMSEEEYGLVISNIAGTFTMAQELSSEHMVSIKTDAFAPGVYIAKAIAPNGMSKTLSFAILE